MLPRAAGVWPTVLRRPWSLQQFRLGIHDLLLSRRRPVWQGGLYVLLEAFSYLAGGSLVGMLMGPGMTRRVPWREGHMVEHQPAVHRTILVVDVEGFGNHRRNNANRLAVRHGMYVALEQAFKKAGIEWDSCDHEDRGDGVLVLAPPEEPKAKFVESLPGELARAQAEHNGTHGEQEQFRLRMALHAGEVYYDRHGVTAASVNLTFRLLDAHQLKDALAESSGMLGLIASGWFFDEVIQHAPASSPAIYRRVRVTVKETTTVAWIALPDNLYPPSQQALDTPAARPTPLVPRQLPACTSTFVGREEELARLTSLLDEGAGGEEVSGAVIISAVNGTAGIGKTALALHWAHQMAYRFPDGQLYVNLRGFDPLYRRYAQLTLSGAS